MTAEQQPPSAAELAGRPTYTRVQLEAYFDLIAVPRAQRRYSLQQDSSPSSDELAYLTLLMKHQVVRVPFENLTLHYSWHRTIDPSPQRVYNKIVAASLPSPSGNSAAAGEDKKGGQNDDDGGDDGGDQKLPVGGGQGGYCMEANSLFHTVLLSIGFDVYLAGARIYIPSEKRYLGFSHCVNLVTIKGDRYLVDVGYGSNVGIRPLKLEVSPSVRGRSEVGPAYEHIGPAKMRLRRETIPQGLSRARGCNLGWLYQVKYSFADGGDDDNKGDKEGRLDDDDDDDEEAGWVTQYMFVDTEFLLEDIAVCNMNPSLSKKSFFTYMLLCVRFTTDLEAGPGSKAGGEAAEREFPGRARARALRDGEIDGTLMLWGDSFKWRRGGRTVLVRKVVSDRDRLDILKNYFGLEFDDEDVRAIKGTAGALGVVMQAGTVVNIRLVPVHLD
ncbi:N-hydroxyarylamine O-acetyltransferase [Microdochium nivale]|nr:N-hydroxyarylamine O-acetyltransferase [Microdochium nivale]